jgi:hypothetical protein
MIQEEIQKSSTVEIVAYHKVKCIFLSLAEIQNEDAHLIENMNSMGKILD